jgi:Lon protease-like protein
MSDDLSDLGAFDGSARLFPLPNLVLFPHVIQPLHIFEPRYRQMTADALAGDRLISVVLLRPGWEENYEGLPPLHRVGCLGKIVAEQRLEGERYNLLLRGLRRVRLLDEVPSDRLYRTAHVELLHDAGSLDAEAVAELRGRLAEQLPRWVPAEAAAAEQFRKLLESDLPAGTLCDVFGFALPLEVSLKQRLLEELDVAERARRLLAMLRDNAPIAAAAPEPDRKFPPDFSAN